eukprot:gene5531-991_t
MLPQHESDAELARALQAEYDAEASGAPRGAAEPLPVATTGDDEVAVSPADDSTACEFCLPPEDEPDEINSCTEQHLAPHNDHAVQAACPPGVAQGETDYIEPETLLAICEELEAQACPDASVQRVAAEVLPLGFLMDLVTGQQVVPLIANHGTKALSAPLPNGAPPGHCPPVLDYDCATGPADTMHVSSTSVPPESAPSALWTPVGSNFVCLQNAPLPSTSSMDVQREESSHMASLNAVASIFDQYLATQPEMEERVDAVSQHLQRDLPRALVRSALRQMEQLDNTQVAAFLDEQGSPALRFLLAQEQDFLRSRPLEYECPVCLEELPVTDMYTVNCLIGKVCTTIDYQRREIEISLRDSLPPTCPGEGCQHTLEDCELVRLLGSECEGASDLQKFRAQQLSRALGQ